MDWRFGLLANAGFQIVSCSGDYARACRDGRDELFRWDGEEWLML